MKTKPRSKKATKAGKKKRRTARPLKLIHTAADVAAARDKVERAAATLKAAVQSGVAANITKATDVFLAAFRACRAMC